MHPQPPLTCAVHVGVQVPSFAKTTYKIMQNHTYRPQKPKKENHQGSFKPSIEVSFACPCQAACQYDAHYLYIPTQAGLVKVPLRCHWTPHICTRSLSLYATQEYRFPVPLKLMLTEGSILTDPRFAYMI